MKTYNVIIGGKNIEVNQNDDGTFIKPQILEELNKFGTALKPAFEPICMAMKPLSEKNFASNVLKYGTGGINIDESRVEAQGKDLEKLNSEWDREWNTNYSDYADKVGGSAGFNMDKAKKENAGLTGRFPANLIHDNSEEVRECFPETKTGAVKNTVDNGANQPINLGGGLTKERLSDSGNASRFFKSIIYQAKASKSERNKGCDELPVHQAGGLQGRADGSLGGEPVVARNFHPTVKPIALMSYLIKMITPKGGVVLDPFAGSGSTLVAAKENDFNFIGIELTEDYIPIIEARTGEKAIKPENPLDCLTDEFKSTGKSYGEGIADKLIELQSKKVELKQNILERCPKCNGCLVKTKYGMTCEDCLTDY